MTASTLNSMLLPIAAGTNGPSVMLAQRRFFPLRATPQNAVVPSNAGQWTPVGAALAAAGTGDIFAAFLAQTGIDLVHAGSAYGASQPVLKAMTDAGGAAFQVLYQPVSADGLAQLAKDATANIKGEGLSDPILSAAQAFALAEARANLGPVTGRDWRLLMSALWAPSVPGPLNVAIERFSEQARIHAADDTVWFSMAMDGVTAVLASLPSPPPEPEPATEDKLLLGLAEQQRGLCEAAAGGAPFVDIFPGGVLAALLTEAGR